MLMNRLTRGELAKRAGVNRETIRYYERHALLLPPARSEAGYCLFPVSAVQRVKFIKRAQMVGFSLEEIRRLLDLKFEDALDGTATCGDVREVVDAKLAEIEDKLQALLAMKRALLHLIEDCPGGAVPISECPVLAAFSDEQPDTLPARARTRQHSSSPDPVLRLA